MRILLLATILMYGCGGVDPIWTGNSDMLDLVARFYVEWDSRTDTRHPVSDIDIGYMTAGERDLAPSDAIGFWQCGTIRIAIDRDTWRDLDSLGREQLVFHEMGHYILSRRHDRGEFRCPWGMCPASIMNPYHIDSDIYDRYREMYLGKLLR